MTEEKEKVRKHIVFKIKQLQKTRKIITPYIGYSPTENDSYFVKECARMANSNGCKIVNERITKLKKQLKDL